MPEKNSLAVAAERRVKSFDLKKKGHSYTEIGKETGVSHMQAWRDVHHVMNALLDESIKMAKQYRVLELARVDDIWINLWKTFHNEDTEIATRLGITDRLIKLIEERSKMLGLYAPQKYERDIPYEGIISETVRQAIVSSEEGRETALILIEKIYRSNSIGGNGKSGGTGMGGDSGPLELPPASENSESPTS